MSIKDMQTDRLEKWLKVTTEKGEAFSVCFLPERGMNFIHFKKNNLDVIDQNTQNLFEERSAGLGAMIGPHFHHRNLKIIPKIKDESLFPHIAALKAKGVLEPFSHGIGRYAPWAVSDETETSLKASLKGSDLWKGIPLKELEGQDFKMNYEARLTSSGLEISLSVVSESESVIGLHTYYALGTNPAYVHSRVKNRYRDAENLKTFDSTWNYQNDQTLIFDLKEEADYGFFPAVDPLSGAISLETATHQVHVRYVCQNEENSWQLYHPKGATFACIEPLSAKDPRKPKLSVSALKILISIH